MAHFAELNENNIVLRVIVVHNNELLDTNGNESEQLGINFCKTLFGENTKWLQTSYNNKFRANFAATGYTYDPVNDVFYGQPLDVTLVLNPTTFQWEPPIPKPDDGKLYRWKSAEYRWVEVDLGSTP
jgi:hypothetical protein